jgi:hypothetical protein
VAANTVRVRGTFDDKISPAIGKVDSRFKGLTKNKGFQVVAQGVGLGAGISGFNLLSSAIGGTVDLVQESVAAASNLNEQINKTEALFKGSADEVEKFGDTTAKAFGISKREALEAAGNFGNLFNTIGLTSDESAKMSTRLVGLAADLASFNNIGTAEALEKIRSGLAGEAEPLRQVGVLLNETAVAAEATALGFTKVNGQFTEGQKVQARYSLILKQTSAAQGDFARTADSMANQQRILNAESEDLTARIGEDLLPVVIAAQRGFIDLFDDIEAGRGPIVAVAQAFDDMGKQLDYLSGYQKDAAANTDILGSKTTLLGQVLHNIFDAGWQTRMDDGSKALNGAGMAASDAKPPMDRFGGSVGKVGDKAEDTAAKFDKMVSDLKSDVERLISDVYDPIEERDHLRENREEADAQRRIIRSKDSTDAQIKDAKRQLRALEADNVDYLTKLVESGDATETEYDRLMTILKRRSGSATGKAKADIDALIAKLKELHRVTVSGPGITVQYGYIKKPHLAGGGYVPPGGSAYVGEEGIEDVHALPSGGVVVTPTGGGNGGGGGEATVIHTHVYLDGKQIAEVVDKHNYYKMQRSAPTALRA